MKNLLPSVHFNFVNLKCRSIDAGTKKRKGRESKSEEMLEGPLPGRGSQRTASQSTGAPPPPPPRRPERSHRERDVQHRSLGWRGGGWSGRPSQSPGYPSRGGVLPGHQNNNKQKMRIAGFIFKKNSNFGQYGGTLPERGVPGGPPPFARRWDLST